MKIKSLLVIVAMCAHAALALMIEPDVFGITLPLNIAPVNADVHDAPEGAAISLEYRAKDGTELIATGAKLRFAPKAWRKFLQAHAGEDIEVRLKIDGSVRLAATNHVSNVPVDAYLTYRLIPPGYKGFGRIGIYQLNLETMDERCIHRNDQGPRLRCMNCHTYNQASADEWMFHVRGPGHGTVIASKKHGLKKVDIPSGRLPGTTTYPAWHPSGEFIAFSVNEARQQFYAAPPMKVEVADLTSDMILYSVADGKVTEIESSPERNECYPAWTPDGSVLYTTCLRTGYAQLPATVVERETVLLGACSTNFCYDLVRRRFDAATRTFSQPEMLIDGPANRMSVTLPRVSPDGRWLVFAAAEYGMFHLWHNTSELWIVDLTTGRVRCAAEVNGPGAESYHSFSSNGRWMVFSSRRDDGLYTRPYIASFDPETGRFGKPFRLPFSDPGESGRRMVSYNIPEFSDGPVRHSMRAIRRVIDD